MSIQKGHMRCVGAADEGASTTSPLSSSSEWAPMAAYRSHLVLPQLSLAFFRLFCSFFITENAVIDVMVWEMVNNIAPLHTFQINKKLSKYMQPILKYSKNNMWFFWTAYLDYVIN
jgi:hypothetical protein